MSLVNFIILLSVLHYGHCLTLTLEDLENLKKLMKAELKEEIFLELPETEEIKRINQKIHEATKGNEETIQNQSTALRELKTELEDIKDNMDNKASKAELQDLRVSSKFVKMNQVSMLCLKLLFTNLFYFRWLNLRGYFQFHSFFIQRRNEIENDLMLSIYRWKDSDFHLYANLTAFYYYLHSLNHV